MRQRRGSLGRDKAFLQTQADQAFRFIDAAAHCEQYTLLFDEVRGCDQHRLLRHRGGRPHEIVHHRDVVAGNDAVGVRTLTARKSVGMV